MCSQLCHRQGNSTCNKQTGELTCAQGFTGRFCHKKCVEGRYGKNCRHKCTCHGDNTRSCRKDTGQCICKAGWRGERYVVFFLTNYPWPYDPRKNKVWKILKIPLCRKFAVTPEHRDCVSPRLEGVLIGELKSGQLLCLKTCKLSKR